MAKQLREGTKALLIRMLRRQADEWNAAAPHGVSKDAIILNECADRLEGTFKDKTSLYNYFME